MSQENVEVAREWYEVLNRWLESYWASPGRPLGETPGTDGVFGAWVWTFRDRSVARITFYQERQAALEAAGLRE